MSTPTSAEQAAEKIYLSFHCTQDGVGQSPFIGRVVPIIAEAQMKAVDAASAESYAQFPVRMTREAYLADAKERDRLSATVSTLRKECGQLSTYVSALEDQLDSVGLAIAKQQATKESAS